MTIRIPKSVLKTLAGTLCIALLVSAGVFIGRASTDEAGARARGHREGKTEGRRELTSELKPGNSTYDEIHDAAYSDGRSAGRRIGTKNGLRQGGDEAFQGFEGGWEIGAHYIIRIGSGSEVGKPNLEYGITTRGKMVQGEEYSLGCSAICSRTIPAGE